MGTHPIFESDFDCLTETKCQIVGWLKKSLFRSRTRARQSQKLRLTNPKSRRTRTEKKLSKHTKLHFRREIRFLTDRFTSKTNWPNISGGNDPMSHKVNKASTKTSATRRTGI